MIFVPVGGDPSAAEAGLDLSPAKAYKTAVSFEPNMIVPYEYNAATLQQFLKEGGQDKNEFQDKATLKRKDLDGKEGYILLLEAQG